MKIYLAPLEGITNYVYRKALLNALMDLTNIYPVHPCQAESQLKRKGKERPAAGE